MVVLSWFWILFWSISLWSLHDWMPLRPLVGHPCSPWQAALGHPQQGPVSPGPLELWLLAMASAASATCWVHQSAFVSLVSHCITHTKGPATRAPTASLCPELAFPKLPNPPLSPATPPPTPWAEIPYTTTHHRSSTPHFPHGIHQLHHHGQHAARGGWGWWLVALASLPFIISQSETLPFLLPSFLSSFTSLSLKCSAGLGWERSPFSLFSWQSQKGVWMGCPWELDCVRRALVFMHSRGFAEPPGPFLLPVISFGLPSPFYLTEELGLLTLPISAQIPSPLTHRVIHFQSRHTNSYLYD